jgi:NAD(P)-dependent dehydrogenase (short-subunit alcohol dehydrogenase family)
MPDELFDLRDTVAVVTGGLGQLGRQFSLALADRGAKVAILDLTADPEVVVGRFGARATDENMAFLAVDVRDRASLKGALAAVRERWGTPDFLLNNAALDTPPGASAAENGPFEEYPETSWDAVMDANLKGVFLCCQVFGGAMAAAGRGSVVNIASIYGMVSPDQRIYEYRRRQGEPFFKPVAYSVSKSGLFNLTRYLATYWSGRGVRVNTLTLAGVRRDQADEFLAAYTPHVPLGRMAREDEYNGAVVFLASSASSYMTGSNLVIDGGWTAW